MWQRFFLSSQQEPRLLAAYANSQEMIESYKQNKDLYARMGQSVYHNNYEDNLEHYPDGSTNVEGKKRRKKMKTVLLGIMYQMAAPSLAERIDVSKEEAESIIENFFNGFPTVKKWIDESKEFAKKKGFVEDFWGRRRRLPDATLPDWTVKSKLDKDSFNPILGINVIHRESPLVKEFTEQINAARYKKQRDAVIKNAEENGIIITNNNRDIGRALRQSVNARIQSSAATMTKKAMIIIDNDPVMKELDFKLLISVHDELIGSCPEENSEKAAERLSYLMSNCVPELSVPFKCDAEIESNWGINAHKDALKKEYKDLIKENMSREEAINYIIQHHEENTEDEIMEVLNGC